MTYNLINKRGVPVLAYPTSDVASQWSCSLVVKHSETRMQATISLQSSLPIHGFDGEQTFTLVYDADNLVPGETCLDHTSMSLTQAQQKEIARQGSPKLKTICLTLKKPCPVWCPLSSGIIAPKHGFDSPFHQLVKLARATEIRIIFDYNWLHRDKQVQFERIVSHPEELAGFTIDNYANRYRQADWTIFSPIEDVASEPPPSYTNVANESLIKRAGKHRRQCEFLYPGIFWFMNNTHLAATPSSEANYPSPKRVLLSPAPIYAPSPTEKATTASTSSPRPPYSPVAYTPVYAPSQTEKAATVTTPGLTSARPPIDYVPDFHDAIKNAVEAVLPGVLQALLPGMLPRFYVDSPSPSSPSPSPTRRRKLDQTPKPNPRSISSLRNLISSRAAAHAEAQLQKIYDDTLDHATDLRNEADTEFRDFLENEKFDVTMARDDGVEELNRMFDEKVEEFRDCTAEILESVEERAEMVYVDVCDRLDDLVGKEKTYLKRERALLEGDRKRFEEERRNAARDRGRRAISLPL
jgi:hypothetical protein